MAELGETPKVGTPAKIENKQGSRQAEPSREYPKLVGFPQVIQERAAWRREVITRQAPARRPTPKPGTGIWFNPEAPIAKTREAEMARRGQAQNQVPMPEKPKSLLSRFLDWFKG